MAHTWPTWAGATDGTAGFVDGVGTEARFSNPRDFHHDGAGTLYVADHGNRAVRAVEVATATVSTILDSSDFGAWIPGAITVGPSTGLVWIGCHLEDISGNDELAVFSWDPVAEVLEMVGHEDRFASIGRAWQIQEVEPGDAYGPGASVFVATAGSSTASGIYELDLFSGLGGPAPRVLFKHWGPNSFDEHSGFVVLPDLGEIVYTHDRNGIPLTPPDGVYTGRVYWHDNFNSGVANLVESVLYPITDGVLSAPGGDRDGFDEWWIFGDDPPDGGDGYWRRIKLAESYPGALVVANGNSNEGPDGEEWNAAIVRPDVTTLALGEFEFPFERYGYSTPGAFDAAVQCAYEIGGNLYLLTGDSGSFGNAIRYFSSGGWAVGSVRMG